MDYKSKGVHIHSGWDAVLLPPLPQPASKLVVSQEVLLDWESLRALPICLCGLQAASGMANPKNYWSKQTHPLGLGNAITQQHKMRRINAHIWNKENHNNRTEFKEIALIFWFMKNGIFHLLLTSGPSILYCVRVIKKRFHDIKNYFPSLNRIGKEIKLRCTFSYKNWEGHIEIISAMIYIHQSCLRGCMNNACLEKAVAHPPLLLLLIPRVERFCHLFL